MNCVNGQFKIIGLLDTENTNVRIKNNVTVSELPINVEQPISQARGLSDSTTVKTTTAMNLIKIHIMEDVSLKHKINESNHQLPIATNDYDDDDVSEYEFSIVNLPKNSAQRISSPQQSYSSEYRIFPTNKTNIVNL